MTFYGRFIVTPAYRGVIGIITSPIEEKALQTGDVNKCQQIPEWTNREQCIKTLAITEKNESFCELMKSTGINNCFIEVAKLKKDSKICENPKLESSYRNNCYQSVFIVSESVCKDFENERFAFSNEREECLKNIAVERRDISMCKFLEWDTKRACEQEIQKQ